jgi:hypothetical protein
VLNVHRSTVYRIVGSMSDSMNDVEGIHSSE